MSADALDVRDCQCKTSLLLPLLLSFLYSFIYSAWRQALFKGLGMAQQTKRRVAGGLLEEVTEPGLDVVQGESRRNLGDNSPGRHARCVFRELQGGLGSRQKGGGRQGGPVGILCWELVWQVTQKLSGGPGGSREPTEWS